MPSFIALFIRTFDVFADAFLAFAFCSFEAFMTFVVFLPARIAFMFGLWTALICAFIAFIAILAAVCNTMSHKL